MNEVARLLAAKLAEDSFPELGAPAKQSWCVRCRLYVVLLVDSPAQPAHGEGADHPNEAHGDGEEAQDGGEHEGQAPDGKDGVDGEANEVAREIQPVVGAHAAQVVPGEHGQCDDRSDQPGDAVGEASPTAWQPLPFPSPSFGALNF